MQSPDQSQSIDEAAARLGVSPATIRRRIKTGEIKAYKHTTAYGFEWRIPEGKHSEGLITSAEQEVISPKQEVITPTQPVGEAPELMKALEMLEAERDEVKRLQAENEELRDSASHWQARYSQAQETLQRLLPAPKDEPAPTKRPWWRRWF